MLCRIQFGGPQGALGRSRVSVESGCQPLAVSFPLQDFHFLVISLSSLASLSSSLVPLARQHAVPSHLYLLVG